MIESLSFLPLVWTAILGVAVAMYVFLDGFDLGIGILFPTTRNESWRDQMMNSVAPYWDGNETWLVLGGGGLWIAFPRAYAIIMPALYVPLIIMLLALIFRGVAFEFRWVAKPSHRMWDIAFAGGSLVAAFAQGLVLGGFLQGFKVTGGEFSGGSFDWLTPFSILCGFGLVAGYALLGACWLVMRVDGGLAEHARRLGRMLVVAVAGLAAAVSLWTPIVYPRIAERWFGGHAFFALWPLPLATAALVYLVWRALRNDRMAITPFVGTIGIFALCYLGLGISTFPYVVPPSLTIWDASSSVGTQAFMLIGVLVLLPVVLAYTAFVYWTFRGRLAEGEGYH